MKKTIVWLIFLGIYIGSLVYFLKSNASLKAFIVIISGLFFIIISFCWFIPELSYKFFMWRNHIEEMDFDENKKFVRMDRIGIFILLIFTSLFPLLLLQWAK